MNATVLCLALAALALLWPERWRRARARRLLAVVSARPGRADHRAYAVSAVRRLGAVPGRAVRRVLATGSGRGPAPPLSAGRRTGPSVPGGPVPAAGVGAVTVALALLAGPVAAVVAGAYAAAALRGWARRRGRAAGEADRARLLEQLRGAASDLRAGLPPTQAFLSPPAPTAGAVRTGRSVGPCDPAGADRLWSRCRAAVVLAERTGAPLAELVERIEADARDADRVRRVAAAQSAGARATGWLLAVLPAGGLALGYVIGADPLPVLLHTPIGAVCALTAVALQLAGLAWTARIVRPAREAW